MMIGRNLVLRLGVAGIGIPLLIGLLYQPDWVWWGFIFVACLLGMREFYGMYLTDKTDQRVSLLVGIIAMMILYWVHRQGALGFVAMTVMALGMYYVIRPQNIDTVAQRYTTSIVGVIYIGGLGGIIALLHRDFGMQASLLLLAATFLSDAGAYVVGSLFGRRKLHPTISTGKTWAGLFGGLAGTAVAMFVVRWWSFPTLTIVDIVILSFVGGLLSQFGDLTESMIKRSCGVKDSGTLLPGHGGVLDRIDSLLFYAPVLYFYFIWFS